MEQVKSIQSILVLCYAIVSAFADWASVMFQNGWVKYMSMTELLTDFLSEKSSV